jgi:hypothetical protein
MEEYTNKGFLSAESIIPKRLFAHFEEVCPRTMDSVRQREYLPHTFNHGDTYLANWYRSMAAWACRTGKVTVSVTGHVTSFTRLHEPPPISWTRS